MNSRDVTDQKINEKSRIAEWTSFLKNEDIQLTSEMAEEHWSPK